MTKTAFLQQLRTRQTLLTALVVGTLINLYGQVLVPYFRGQGDALSGLGRNCAEAPLIAVVSIALGYAFPVYLAIVPSGVRSTSDRPELKSA